MSRIELLAPSGSYEALVAAIQNGANAIYLGGSDFSARAFATNFTNEQLTSGVKYAHLRNVKVYVTINTLYEDNQFPLLHDYLLFLSNIQVDGLIIQDMGLVAYIQTNFPQLEIHLSTQASIHNLPGVQYFENKGIKRIVLARENSIEEITQICKNTNMDIEVFVHGALCMSYSGQCLMSSMIAKRSGNKGACGQPCRLKYHLQKNDKIESKEAQHLLSPKDLCTIDHIEALIEAGVTSFKIEGRMKRPEYVAIVVRQYRQAIDHCLKHQKLDNIDGRKLQMKKMFNRGFTSGYLFHDQDFMAKDFPGNRGILTGKVIEYQKRKKLIKIKLVDNLKQGDRILFQNLDLTRTITKLYQKGRLINQASAGTIVEIELNQMIKNNTEVYKIIDSTLIDDANKSYQDEKIKNPISMIFSAKLNEYPTLKINYGNYHSLVQSSLLVEQAKKAPLEISRIKQQLSKLGNTVFVVDNIDIDFPENGFFSIKEINEMRRQAIKQLEDQIVSTNNYQKSYIKPDKKVNSKQIKGIDVRVYNYAQLESLIDQDIHYFYFPLNHEFDQAFLLGQSKGKTIIPFTGFLSNIDDLIAFKQSKLYPKIKAILVGDYGALEIFKDKNCILDFTFNLTNSKALHYFNSHMTVLSLEMTKNNINNLINVNQETILTVYGKNINMHLKHCIITDFYHGYQKKYCNLCRKNNFSLIDRKGERFAILTDQYCNNLLFNSHCLYLENINDVNVDYILLSFSDENKQQCLDVFNDYHHNILHDKPRQIKTFTKLTNSYFYD